MEDPVLQALRRQLNDIATYVAAFGENDSTRDSRASIAAAIANHEHRARVRQAGRISNSGAGGSFVEPAASTYDYVPVYMDIAGNMYDAVSNKRIHSGNYIPMPIVMPKPEPAPELCYTFGADPAADEAWIAAQREEAKKPPAKKTPSKQPEELDRFMFPALAYNMTGWSEATLGGRPYVKE